MNNLPNRPRKCLVTGAAGFIGTRLCEYFDEQKNQNYVPFVRNTKTAVALRSRWPEMATGDLLNTNDIRRALRDCDAVVHLAHSSNGPLSTRNLVDCAIQSGVKRFVHISTMSVHGPVPGPEAAREETAKITRYNHDYSDSKAEQEEIVQAAQDRGDLQVVILRPTIVYGPHSHFVLQVVQQAKEDDVTVFDNGTGICNAVYVDDVCRAIDASLTSEHAIGHAMFVNGDESLSWGDFIRAFAFLITPDMEIRNLHSSEALRYWTENPSVQTRSLLDRIVRKVKQTAGFPSPSIPWPSLGRVQRETFPIFFANEKAKQLLSWSPQVDFVNGLALTRQWLVSEGYLA